MSGVQFLIMAALSAIVTFPAVVLIPRARQSPAFDRVLWAATWLLGFLGAWYAVDNFSDSQSAAASALNLAQVPAVPALIGALVGTLSLNVLLWLMDRFTPPVSEEMGESQIPADGDAVEEEHDRTSSE